MKKILSVLILVGCITNCVAQEAYEFKTGLVASRVHRYGREAVVSDELLYRMASGRLEKPREGARFHSDDQGEIKWTRIEVDSAGRFRDSQMSNAYLYLTYESARPVTALLNVSGNVMCYVNGEPRGGDIYNDGWMYLPVKLKKGLNEIYVRCNNFSRFQGVKARLEFPGGPVSMSSKDATLPHVIVGRKEEELLGAVVILNTSDKPLTGLMIRSDVNGRAIETAVPDIPALTMRKTGFGFSSSNVPATGEYACQLQLRQGSRVIATTSLNLSAVKPEDHSSHTFRSEIDGSVQYYGVAPYAGDPSTKPALFLSVHGAGVEAIGQARAYQPKDWGVLVAPTNRRPRGFNWEDWGRLDALEVFDLARMKFDPDPERIYLTGHSMGGHGTWYLGATYPDKWAAIAPCAGYPTLSAYGSADGRIPDSARTSMERTVLRASNPSNVLALSSNYKHHGVYVFHGDADRTVPVRFARQMRELLAGFHPDFSYYEYPGGSHWFGNESVDWPPIFEYFKWHKLKADSAVDAVHFVTANPAISSTSRWVSVIQQIAPLEYSEVDLTRDKKQGVVSGWTKNAATLRLDLTDLAKAGRTITVTLDSSKVEVAGDSREIYLARTNNGWAIASAPGVAEKNDRRGGTLKEAFNHRMVFVYGTAGNAEEDRWAYNKARYDAEVWYYRGNGAVDVIPDHQFTSAKYPDRGVILYGNSATNSAWSKLLSSCPIVVTRDRVTIGSTVYQGTDLGGYFVWPRPDSETASVGVITGTGLPGLQAAEANQYFAGGSGFPDYLFFSVDMLRQGAAGLKAAGFYDNKWRITEMGAAETQTGR